jgi:predicted nuclease of predicted toxin-antitoxin system
VRVDGILPKTASDEEIVAAARDSGSTPSLITLRLASSRVEHVNEVLARVLPQIEGDLVRGSAVTVEEGSIRSRTLPID